MTHSWLWIVGTVLLVGTVLPPRLVAQTERGPYARIALPDKVSDSIAKTTVEILNLRPTMSYGLSPARE